MLGAFTTALVTEIILKLLKLYHSAKIYVKKHLTNNDLIQGRDILHKVWIIFNFQNENITGKQISISMKPPNWSAKEFLVIKESCPIRTSTKGMKQILDAKYKKLT